MSGKMKRYRKVQRLIKTRRYYATVANRYRKNIRTCGHHNMRGDR